MESDEKKTCDDCQGDASQGWVEHFRQDKGKEPVLVKTQCPACDLCDRMAQYRKTKRLCNRITLPAALFVGDERILTEPWMQSEDRASQRQDIRARLDGKAKYAADFREIASATDEIQEAVQTLGIFVWGDWLQDYYSASEHRGHKARIGDVEVLVWGCAGRVMMTINRGEASVTAIFNETSETPRGGLHGLDATKEQALSMLADVTTHPAAFRAAIAPDAEVGMF